MEQLKLLEVLAESALPHAYINKLCQNALLPEAIKTAFLSNNSEMLRKNFSSVEYFANESHVIQIITKP